MGVQDMAYLRSLMVNGDVQSLISALRDESRSCPERRFAAAALGDLHAGQAIEPLVSVLQDKVVCEAAIQALVSIGDPIAAAPLAEIYASADDRVLRKNAERALCCLNEKDPNGVRRVLASYERSKERLREPGC
jgi:HEAT repeat protein